MGNRSGAVLVAEPARYRGRAASHHGGAMMAIATNFVAGTGVLFLAIQTLWSALGPEPPPIVVHSLTYENGYIVQDRTVNSDGKFTALWTAQIQDKATGLSVPGCQGSGTWDYEAGRKTPRIPVAEWVGSPECALPAGTFIPVATYMAGDFKLVQRGQEFTK